MVEYYDYVMSVPFVDALRERMERLGTSFVRPGFASAFEIDERDGVLGLLVHRAVDGSPAGVTMTGTTEVFFLRLGDAYTSVQTAYDDDYRWEVLDDFLGCLGAFLEGDYYEEVGERNGRLVSKVIYLRVPGGPRTISAALGWRARLLGLFGYKKSIVRPAQRRP
jgi:hypothetical protein